MITLIFIRHGATIGNLEKRYIGRTDEPLCDKGISQVLENKKRVPVPDKIFVSPMLRTRQTAELLFPQMFYTVADGLREADFGEFEGKTASELSENAAYRTWVDGGCISPIPGGESVAEFKKRCCMTFEKTMESVFDNDTVVFVVHGGVIMSILEAYAKPAQSFYTYHVENGECVICEFEKNSNRISVIR